MNKFFTILRTAFLPILFVSLAFVACEGPAGADGVKGDTGATGPKGDKGDTGLSGAEQCGVCHNNATTMFAKQAQWEASLHGEGDVYLYGNRTDCAPCHTNEGYQEVKETGAYTVKAAFANPTTINCRTCHTIHTKYDATDWALTKTSPVKLFEGGESVDLGAKSNTCGQCHQSRTVAKINTSYPADSLYSITSSRFGPHHGPQSNYMSGKGIYLPVGSKTYPTNNVHKTANCGNCHMTAVPGGYHETMGGHSMSMKIINATTGAYDAQNVLGCADANCHGSTAKTKFNDIDGYWDAFVTDFGKLKQLMIDKGWYDKTTELLIATSAKPIKVTHNQAAAIYAFQMIKEDKGMGIHNPKLARAMLDNAMEVLSK